MSRAYGLTLLLPSMPARSTERAVVSSMPSGGAGVTDRVTKAVARLWRAACRSPDCRDDRPRGRGRIGAADGESRQCDRWCDVDAHECLQPVDRDRQPDTTASVPNFDIELAVITTVLATAAGSVIASHVNDSGFWLVGRLMGLDVATIVKTWTVNQTLIAVIGLVLASAFYGVTLLF